MSLSTAIAHTHTEQAMRPIITDLTIQWACQNRVKMERSDGAASVGSMISSFRLGGQSRPGRRRGKDLSKGANPDLIGPVNLRGLARNLCPLPAFPRHGRRV